MSANDRSARKLLAQALEVQESTLPTAPAMGETEAWDSLAHMRLILAIEEALGRQLAPEAVLEVTNLAAIEKVLAAPGG
ncbi:MAG: acyl carrier protein [Kiloniellales bacterium]